MKVKSLIKTIEIHLTHMVIKVNLLLIPVMILSVVSGYALQLLMSFMLVFIHELSHCKAARGYGIPIAEIEVFPFGGVVRMADQIAAHPQKEIVIALAGPFSNFVLLMLGYLAGLLFSWEGELFQVYLTTNLVMGGLNLLPILPLDGGRVLRALLSIVLGIKNATLMSILVGKILTVGLFFFALLQTIRNIQNLYFLLLCVFLYGCLVAERKNAAYLFFKEILNKKTHLQVKGIMSSRYLTVLETYPISHLFLEFQSGKYHFVSVINVQGKVLGTLTEIEILEALGGDHDGVSIGSLILSQKNKVPNAD